MKPFTTAVVVMMAIAALSVAKPAVAFDGTESHGGDAVEKAAKPFPEETLSAAVEVMQQKLAASAYDAKFVQSIRDEFSALRSDGRLLVVPELIFLSKSEGGLSPKDYRTFLDLGAMTTSRPGDPVYFAQRILDYSPSDLAKLIIHEVLHHLLAWDFTGDEAFVDALATSLMEGRYSRNLEISAVHAIRFENGRLSGSGILDRIMNRAMSALVRNNSLSDVDQVRRSYLEIREKQNTLNLLESSVSTLFSYLHYLVCEANYRVVLDREAYEKFNKAFYVELTQIAKEVDPSNPLHHIDRSPGCRISTPWYWPFCPDDQELQMRDLFNPARLGVE